MTAAITDSFLYIIAIRSYYLFKTSAISTQRAGVFSLAETQGFTRSGRIARERIAAQRPYNSMGLVRRLPPSAAAAAGPSPLSPPQSEPAVMT